ncbi:hypothetical protein ACED51_10490 [Photobacterium swingsii]
MSHSNRFPHRITKPFGASNVSPLQPSGSTTMNRTWCIDHRLYGTYQKLRACQPSVLLMVKALNVLLAQHGQTIETCFDLEEFIDAIDEFERVEGLS